MVGGVGFRLLKGFGLVVGSEAFDDFIDFPLEYLIKFVERKTDAMIGDPALGKIISSDATAAVAASYLPFSLLAAFGVAFLYHAVVKSGP